MKNSIKSLSSIFLVILIAFSVFTIYKMEKEKYNRAINIKNNIKLTYMVDGKVYLEENISNSKVDNLPVPVKEGYIFKYWEVNEKEFKVNDEIKEDTILSAVFEKEQEINNNENNISKDNNNDKQNNNDNNTNNNNNTSNKDNATISINNKYIVEEGNRGTLSVTITPSDTKDKTVTWTSSDSSIVSVNNGIIKGIREGKATITAKLNNGNISLCEVTVIKKTESDSSVIKVTGINLDKNSGTLEVGKTMQLTGTVIPSNATDKTITWTSSDSNIASVSSSGLVTAKNEGSVTITAISGLVKASATIKVQITTTDSYCIALHNANVKELDYQQFINKFPSNDDYDAIKATHNCANKYNLPVNVTKGTYNIYKKNNDTITVKTNTNFNNSTVYIHDESEIVGKFNAKHIFSIVHEKCSSKTMNTNNLKYSSTIELKNKYVRVTDSSHKVFIRTGSNTDSGYNAMDSFRTDSSGKIIDPLFWNYDNKNVDVYYCDIPSNSLTFKNATFYNIVDTQTSNSTKSALDSVYLRRGILINRSNVTISNITHKYINSNKQEVSSFNHDYYGFFNINNAANITFDNLKVHAVKNNNKNVNSTYDIILDNVANVKITNTKMIDYDGTSDYFNKTSSQLRNDVWGVIASNNAKNVSYDNCVLNRIDTHRGVYNISIKNTKIGKWGINAIGYGTLNIDNVDIYYINHFINLRSDYGSLWDGTVKINNSRIHPGNNNNAYIILFKIAYDNDYLHNYGYNLALPKINITNFKVDSTINKLYIFNNSEANTGLVKGKLNTVNNYIKNNAFTYYYPKKSNISVSDIKNKNNSISSQNYIVNFGEN